ncbi:interactor of HORMAD1 protein 1 isoform X2 [Dendropsophus ebraccatus]|uniref:interactor of HORMAD1 protein 1 isoform X2 n=1 Tax=Dendropsophus ebraccatus TaxID=150705 RepID=UPI003831DE14
MSVSSLKMNLNVWNIKDMFSIPPGAGISKSATRSAAQSDHSSLSDSQFLFSSQLCPDSSSQQGSMDYATQTKYQKNSTQNSQDSEPSIFQKYQAKPPLCNSDSKERSTFHPFGATKTKDIIEQFEESKKRAKEKHESEQFTQLICNIQETLQNLKIPFFNIEENTNVRCQSILDGIYAVSKALEEKISVYQESLLKVMPLKSDLEQAMVNLEKKIHLKDAEISDLKSNIQLLLSALDTMKSQQSEKHLELSERLTQLSGSMQSSEDRILSEIRGSKLVSEPTCSLKDKTTQTSPICIQDLSIKEHITSQCKTISTSPDEPSPSSTHVSCTCGGISNTLSVQHRGNPCVTEVKGRKPCNVTSAGSARESLAEFKNSNDQTRWKNAITMDDTAVTSAHNLHYLCQDDSGIQNDNTSRNTRQYSKKENQVIVTRSKTKNNRSKRPKMNRPRKGKKRTKNTTQVPSRANFSQCAPGNEPVTQQWANTAKDTQDCFTPFSQNCGSSISAITPVLLRRTQRKNSLKFSLIRSQQLIEQSEIKGAGSGEENEPGHCKAPSWDSNNPHYSKISECEDDKIVWFPSSSPLYNNSSTHPAQKKGQKDLLTLFSDSSDDSD